MSSIVLLTSQWPGLTAGGGIARPMESLAKVLVHAGKSVAVVVCGSDFPRSLDCSIFGEQIEIRQVAKSSRIDSLGALRWRENISDVVADSDPSLVIAQDWLGLAGVFAHSPRECPLVTWGHGGTLYDLRGQRRQPSNFLETLQIEFESVQISESDAFVSPSRFLVDLYQDVFNLKLPPVLNSPYWFPNCETNRRDLGMNSESSYCFAFVGRLTVRKGVQEFFDFMVAAKSELGEVRAEIYGSSADYWGFELSRELSSQGIACRFNGYMPPGKMWAELAEKSATLVVTSILDNSPNTVYEATGNGISSVIIGKENGAAELSAVSPLVHSFESQESVDWGVVALTTRNEGDLDLLSEENRRTSARWIELVQTVKRLQHPSGNFRQPDPLRVDGGRSEKNHRAKSRATSPQEVMTKGEPLAKVGRSSLMAFIASHFPFLYQKLREYCFFFRKNRLRLAQPRLSAEV